MYGISCQANIKLKNYLFQRVRKRKKEGNRERGKVEEKERNNEKVREGRK